MQENWDEVKKLFLKAKSTIETIGKDLGYDGAALVLLVMFLFLRVMFGRQLTGASASEIFGSGGGPFGSGGPGGPWGGGGGPPFGGYGGDGYGSGGGGAGDTAR